MMEFIRLNKKKIRELCNKATKKELMELLNICEEFINFELKYRKYSLKLQSKTKRTVATKDNYVSLFTELFEDNEFKAKLYNKLIKTELSKYLYESLVWENGFLPTEEVSRKYNYQFKKYIPEWYGEKIERLPNNLFADNISLVSRKVVFEYNKIVADVLFINDSIKKLLQLIMPLPQNYYLKAVEVARKCEYHYNNEVGVLEFVDTIYPMLENNLVAFNTTKIKPLAKSLNILKQTSGIEEFYSEKKLNSLATDMLTRSFANYYWKNRHKFEQPQYNAIKHFLLAEFGGHFDFMISRIFLSHLKKVRYDSYYQDDTEIFDTIKWIVSQMPQENYVSMKNILEFCKYREIEIDIDASNKRYDYVMDCDIITENGKITETLRVGYYYDILMFEPLLKAAFFYLGAFGLFELEYEEPYSLYTITAKDKEYISHWDGLEYVKLTELGKYVFGLRKDYEYKKETKRVAKIKFDEYKPIITVDKSDIITQAKLESFADKYDTNRYILSYTKLFKDVKSKKALEMKIESFYKQIGQKPPKVFDDFFDEVRANANLLKRNLKQVVIELQNNKKLLHFLMHNKKIQELITKAEGYRIIVAKENIPKLTKILKENGFFVDF